MQVAQEGWQAWGVKQHCMCPLAGAHGRQAVLLYVLHPPRFQLCDAA
jgi:hypothetical protein